MITLTLAIRDGFHLCLPLNAFDLSKGAEEEKKRKEEENADWLAAESRRIVHEVSPNLRRYVIFDERGECEELSRAAEGLAVSLCRCRSSHATQRFALTLSNQRHLNTPFLNVCSSVDPFGC